MISGMIEAHRAISKQSQNRFARTGLLKGDGAEDGPRQKAGLATRNKIRFAVALSGELSALHCLCTWH
jgi:hypothetical protein